MPQVTMQEAVRLAQERAAVGRWREAEDIFRQILTQKPDHAESWHQLGLLAQTRGDFNAAADRFLHAIQCNATADHYHANLAAVYLARGQLDAAIRSYHTALELKPTRAETYNNLANALLEDGKIEEAIIGLQQAIALNSNIAEFHANLGVALEKAGRLADAIAAQQRAIELKPNFAEAYSHLGVALEKSARADDAIAAQQKAIGLKPDFPDAYNNLSVALRNLGRLNEAITAARRSIQVAHDFAEGHLNLATNLLVAGQFVEGWREYEWRWKCKGFQTRPSLYPQPTWDGSDPKGHTILVSCEQGLGDTIQFIRYAPLVAKRGACVVVGCPPPLKSLLQTADGIAEVIAEGEKLPRFDLQISLMSLPRVFETTLETIPADIPYFTTDQQKVNTWRTRLNSDSSLKIGLAWAGRPEYRNDLQRSIPLQAFAPLFVSSSNSAVSYYSLQKGEAAKQIHDCGFPIADLTTDLHDFSDTAALIANLDLVIAVDTAVAHLAGALGKSVWTLLPFAPDFRWLLDRDDSPWYPTMRLFRQPAPGDWNNVVSCVARGLATFAEKTR